MNNAVCKFQLGKFSCQVIDDGLIKVPVDRTMGLKGLFIRTGDHNVLIDTGEGNGTTTIAGKLLENLRQAGIRTTEIDTVILTHGHSDHIGGCADDQGQPLFPNARYIMHEIEWNYWMARLNLKSSEESSNEHVEQRDIVSGRKNLLSIKEYFDIVKGEPEVVPGIKFILAPGHTPGNVVAVISSGQKQLMCIGDILHEAAEFTTPGLWARADYNVEEAAKTRDRILSIAVESHALVFINHFPFPGLGYIVKKDHVLDWEPFENR
jgi:glyoxylase-like metal-dependent hydrolase (beta-lactamase superfamily II)